MPGGSEPRKGSEYLFSERRTGQFDGEVGGAVVLVDHRVDFDDFEAEHAAVVGEDLHRQVSFAISCAAAHRGAAGRGVGRVEVGGSSDPEDADLLILATVERRHAGNRSYGNGVISAEDKRGHSFFQCLADGGGGAAAGVGNLLQVTCVRAPEV